MKECFTVISVDLKNPLIMKLDLFFDREKMREFLLEQAKNHRRCIIIPGAVDDIDYQVENGNIHFEDEGGYRIPFNIVSSEEFK